MSAIKAWKLITLFCLFSVMLGCSSQEEQLKQAVEQSIVKANSELQALGTQLDTNALKHAVILKQYADLLKQQQPDLAQIATLIGKDATREGALFQGLKKRLNTIETMPLVPPYEPTLQQLDLLREALNPNLFSDALTDPINMLADMSQGKLARIGAISKAAEDEGEGNQLVGNPNYGSWQTNSSGMSFWAWYGMYSMLDNVVDRVKYGSWSKRRRYSYYHDYGRSRYSSPAQIKTQQQVERRTRQSYTRQGKQFTSPYAKKRVGASGLSRSSYTPPKTRSSYAKKSSYSKGSVRNSSSRTSRGVSRGK